MKECRTCGDTKPFSEFFKDKRNRDGRTWQCKDCGRARNREYISRPEVKTHRKAYNKKYNKSEARKRYYRQPQRKAYSSLMQKLRYTVEGGSENIDIGCTPQEFRDHLESQFKQGMGWHNKGEWHIDHVIPCSRFDLTDPKEAKMAFHYSNLQPLWGKDNLAKGGR